MSTFDIIDLLGPPDFCAGTTSNYLLGTVTPITLPITLIAGKDWISVDFPADTDLSNVVHTGVWMDAAALDGAASLSINGQHLEFLIPSALAGLCGLGTPHFIQINGVVNPSTGATYCLYLDYVESCAPGNCQAVQFACEEYVVAPATKDIGCHFDFDDTYTGIAEDFIPPFLAGGAPVLFDFIVRDENGGCSDPCTNPSAFWFEVIACPLGETISFTFAGAAGSPYTLTNADQVAGTKFDLMAAWIAWPPPDQSFQCSIAFSSPGDYELQFFIQCPMGGCPSCAGPTVVTTCALPAKAYQYLDEYKIDIDEKWDLISLPLFPYDTSIAGVFAAMDHLDQLVSVWHFDQCEDPAPDAGVWHTAAYSGGAFAGTLTEIQTGRAYWVRTLHLGETGYVAYGVPNNGLWVFGTHAIMPDPTGVDMGYFDVCEGWNMVGFKPRWVAGAPVTDLDSVYLWNFNTGVMDTVHYGLIYDWNSLPLPGDWTSWAPTTLTMQPGDGYWIPFDGNDQIYPAA
jgi:hypothetical protein